MTLSERGKGEIGLNSGRQVAPLKLTKRLNSIRRTRIIVRGHKKRVFLCKIYLFSFTQEGNFLFDERKLTKRFVVSMFFLDGRQRVELEKLAFP
jgi:hypothetical protein